MPELLRVIKTSDTCTTTHSACACVVARLTDLEAQLAALREEAINLGTLFDRRHDGLTALRKAAEPVLLAQDRVHAHISACSACGGIFGMCERGLILWRDGYRQLTDLRALAEEVK